MIYVRVDQVKSTKNVMGSKKLKTDVYTKVADFIYETSIHSRTPRSGFWFLGSGVNL